MSVNESPISSAMLHAIAIEAGRIMTKYAAKFGIAREVKPDGTPLTIADTEIHAMVVQKLRELSRDIDIVGEEGNDRTDSPWRAVFDPIDGTFPFTWGMPVSTFMLSIMHQCKPVMGVIYDPFTDRMFQAEQGRGAFMNSTRLKVSTAAKREDRPVVGFVSWPGSPYNILTVCQYLEERGVNLVNLCSVGYVEAAVANGEFAGSIFPGKHYHDTAPGHIIVTEAGGTVTDIFGRPIDYSNNEIAGHIMSNGAIHPLLVEAVLKYNT